MSNDHMDVIKGKKKDIHHSQVSSQEKYTHSF